MSDLLGEGPELLLRGAKDVVETLSFLMWIDLEGMKFSFFGLTTALKRANYDLADKIARTTLPGAAGDLNYWIFLYGIGGVPSWPAYYCFLYFANEAADWWRGNIAECYLQDSLGNVKNSKGKWVKKGSRQDDMSEYSPLKG